MIQFGSNFIKEDLYWTQFKARVASKKLKIQMYTRDDYYLVYAIDYPIVYLCNVYRTPLDGYADPNYSQSQSDDDLLDFETNYLATANQSLSNKDSVGRVVNVLQPRVGDEVIYATHNFCDKTTWYSNSERVLNQTLTDSGDGLTWTSPDQNWIDMVSGRVLDDDGLVEEQQILNPGDPHGYSVVVTVDNVTATMREPFAASGGDYTIDYDNGSITFFSSKAGKSVKATYSKATDSVFILRPLPGKTLDIEAAEADFSSDLVMNDAVYYSVYGLVDVFAPELMPGIPTGTKIPLKTSYYKRYSQIQREAIGAFPVLAANAADPSHLALSYPEFRKASRGTKSSVFAIPFRYATIRQLLSSAGMELRVGLVNDNMFGGETATLTFYCTSSDE